MPMLGTLLPCFAGLGHLLVGSRHGAHTGRFLGLDDTVCISGRSFAIASCMTCIRPSGRGKLAVGESDPANVRMTVRALSSIPRVCIC